jgi:hemolysin activation/secretion protein
VRIANWMNSLCWAVAVWLGVWASCVAADKLSTVPTLLVRDIQIDGDLIPRSVLDEVLPRYRNQMLSSDDLVKLAQQLTAYLVESGYVNSGVILPDQKIENGVVHLHIVAGRVGEVVVTGNRHLSDSYITSRIETGDAPFNINSAVSKLQKLERDPRIKRLNAELKPSTERGSALLNIDIEEKRMWGASASVDNHISPNVGGVEALFDAYYLSLFGLGDSLTVGYRQAEGFKSGSGQYSVPLNRFDTRVTLLYDQNSSTIVNEPFALLDIEGFTRRYGIVIRQPLVNSLNTELSVELGVHREQVESFLLGEPFSFAVSDADGMSNVTLVQFSQELVHRSAQSVLALRSTFYVGVDALQASVGGDGDGVFIEWLGQGEWLRKLDWLNSMVGVKLQGHLTNDSLPAYRKYSLGGANSVRGYRENLIVRDEGVLASIEWTLPLAHFQVPWLGDDPGDGQIALVPFADYGYGWDYFVNQNNPEALASVGVGVEWHIGRNSNIELQYGKALIDHIPDNSDKTLQDLGVHFSIRLGF